MLMSPYKASHLSMPHLSSGCQSKHRGCRVIHRAGCGAQPTHPRPALWITRMAPNGLGKEMSSMRMGEPGPDAVTKRPRQDAQGETAC